MFFIIWRGWGILAPLILIVISGLLKGVIDSFVFTGFSDSHRQISSIGILLGSVICWFLGKYLNGKPGRIVIDEKTGQRFQLKKTHSCFFIPFEYWAIIGVFASVIILFYRS